MGSITQWKRIAYSGYVYPDWAQALAWLLALCSFVMIPVRAIGEIVHPEGSFREVSGALRLIPVGPSPRVFPLSSDDCIIGSLASVSKKSRKTVLLTHYSFFEYFES